MHDNYTYILYTVHTFMLFQVTYRRNRRNRGFANAVVDEGDRINAYIY